jgi:hypothetical protein
MPLIHEKGGFLLDQLFRFDDQSFFHHDGFVRVNHRIPAGSEKCYGKAAEKNPGTANCHSTIAFGIFRIPTPL